MGDLIKGRFGNRATVDPMEAWLIDLENISHFDDQLRRSHIAKCPDPDSQECKDAIAWLEELKELRQLQSGVKLSVVS